MVEVARVLSLTLLVLATGCATVQTPPRQAVPVPADRMLPGHQTLAGPARAVVIRDTGFHGGGCYYLLSVNRVPVARVNTGESVVLQVPAGELMLSISGDPAGRMLCGIAPDHIVQREFVIKAGESKHFRMATGPQGMDIMRSDF